MAEKYKFDVLGVKYKGHCLDGHQFRVDKRLQSIQQSVYFSQEMKEQITWLSLGANNCNPSCSETDKNVNGKEPLETTTPLLTQSTVWQDMSRPLYSGCEQDTGLK